ncbi:MAG: NlpC/P60 family protein [Thermaerobacter sp.]|nr:NlpC/P60 family protein [Thermaerobacter sp.]
MFTTYASGPSHHGVYIGDRRLIAVDSGSGRVVVNSLRRAYWATRYCGAHRIGPGG